MLVITHARIAELDYACDALPSPGCNSSVILCQWPSSEQYLVMHETVSCGRVHHLALYLSARLPQAQDSKCSSVGVTSYLFVDVYYIDPLVITL